MFGLSGEHLLILAGVLLIFGPRKLPELGSSIGRALKNFKEGLNGPTPQGPVTPLSAPKEIKEAENTESQKADNSSSPTV